MNSENTKLTQPLILGAQGQVGRALATQLNSPNLILGTRGHADLANPQACLKWIQSIRPTLIFNAAAYTQVDQAEKDSDLAYRINSETPGLIAKWCAQNDVPFIHFSTDYVFSGEGSSAWKETDPIAPLNTYGKSKAEGEQKIAQSGSDFLIFRTSWVYDAYGKNFLKTMLRLGQEKEQLKIVNDQVGAPTYAPDLAEMTIQAVEKALTLPIFPSGIYHLSHQGETTWYEFAKAIFDSATKRGIPLKVQSVLPILSSEYPTPAVRPKNSRLNTDKAFFTFGIRLPHWKDGLIKCMQELK